MVSGLGIFFFRVLAISDTRWKIIFRNTLRAIFWGSRWVLFSKVYIFYGHDIDSRMYCKTLPPLCPISPRDVYKSDRIFSYQGYQRRTHAILKKILAIRITLISLIKVAHYLMRFEPNWKKILQNSGKWISIPEGM